MVSEKARCSISFTGSGDFKIAENKELCLRRFNAHNEKVKAYFKDRPDDLLCWDLEAEPNWDKLARSSMCRFPPAIFLHGKRQRLVVNLPRAIRSKRIPASQRSVAFASQNRFGGKSTIDPRWTNRVAAQTTRS